MTLKLISADELLRTLCAPCIYRGDKCLGAECDVDVVCAIREARAVDAIPVEWIKHRMEQGMDARVLTGDLEEAVIARSCWNVLEVWKREAKA
jgi:hypothetical protein